MKRDTVVVCVIALLALVIMSYAPDITGMAYSRTLGRTETRFSPAMQDCQTNEDCPAGSSCRPYGALQRIRRKARTGCVPICEDSEQNRIPLAVFEQLKAAHDINTITGFDPHKPKPTRYRPKNSFETFLYPSNCKDTTTVVEPFCVDAATDNAAVGTIDINCAALGDGFGCVEDDNGDAGCGQVGEGDDAQRLYAETGGSEAVSETTETSGEETGAQETETAPEPPETGEQEAPEGMVIQEKKQQVIDEKRGDIKIRGTFSSKVKITLDEEEIKEIEKLKTCKSQAVALAGAHGFALYKYTVKEKKENVCSIEEQFVENINPAFVGPTMICEVPLERLETRSFMEYKNKELQSGLPHCTGRLKELFLNPSKQTETAIEIRDFQFIPPTITVPVDTPTEIVVKNSGQATHTFTVEELGINEELAAGEEKTVEISAPPGTFSGQCNHHPSMKISVQAE